MNFTLTFCTLLHCTASILSEPTNLNSLMLWLRWRWNSVMSVQSPDQCVSFRRRRHTSQSAWVSQSSVSISLTLYPIYTIEQTSSRRRAIARVFWIHLLDVCSMFARSCKRGISVHAFKLIGGVLVTTKTTYPSRKLLWTPPQSCHLWSNQPNSIRLVRHKSKLRQIGKLEFIYWDIDFLIWLKA